MPLPSLQLLYITHIPAVAFPGSDNGPMRRTWRRLHFLNTHNDQPGQVRIGADPILTKVIEEVGEQETHNTLKACEKSRNSKRAIKP